MPQVPVWLEYADPEADAGGWRWRFHVPFLLSAYTCVFGTTCKGTYGDGGRGCCSDGTPLGPTEDPDESERLELERVDGLVAKLKGKEWQRKALGESEGWKHVNQWGEWATRVVDGACIFHNDPDFPGGMGCAFHVAATRRGEEHVDWKPDTCWRVPIHTEDIEDEQVSVIRATHAADWDPDEGTDPTRIDWWCTNDPIAYVGDDPVYVSCETELRTIVGDAVYDQLAADLDAVRGPMPLPLPMADQPAPPA